MTILKPYCVITLYKHHFCVQFISTANICIFVPCFPFIRTDIIL